MQFHQRPVNFKEETLLCGKTISVLQRIQLKKKKENDMTLLHPKVWTNPAQCK